MDNYKFVITEDASEAIAAYLRGANVIFHTIENGSVKAYEISPDDKISNYSNLPDTMYFIYE